MSETLQIIGFTLVGCVVALTLVAVIVLKMKKVENSGSAKALEFERSVLHGAGSSGAAGATAPAGSAPAAYTEPRDTREQWPAPAETPSPSSVPVAENLPPFAAGIASKLEIAGLLESAEAPLRSKKPGIEATVLRLRGGRLIAVLEEEPRSGHPDHELLFRRFHALVVPGPGDNPLFVRTFKDFLVDSISL